MQPAGIMGADGETGDKGDPGSPGEPGGLEPQGRQENLQNLKI